MVPTRCPTVRRCRFFPTSATPTRKLLIASVERPRVRSGDVRIGMAVLWVTAVLVIMSAVIAGAQLADDIRQTRAMVQDRCDR